MRGDVAVPPARAHEILPGLISIPVDVLENNIDWSIPVTQQT
jgi:hypothetical protein